MGLSRSPSKLGSFGLNRVASRARIQSPCIELEPISASADADYDSSEEAVAGRRVMVVVNTSLEAKSALQWALSHGVQNQDTLVLLTVVKPGRRGDQHNHWERDPRSHKLVCAMKNICQAEKPKVQVKICRVEGKDEDQGKMVVEEARKQEIPLLVLGQKKRSMRSRLSKIFSGPRSRDGGVVDYCLQNATCMTLAVRRRGRRGGGYLITTKQHKDFWVLA